MLGFGFLSEGGGGNPFSALPKKPLGALHGARIRKAKNMPQGMFCVRPRLARRRAGFSGVEARKRFNEFPEKLPRPFRPRIRFPPAESTNKNAPRGGDFICWWSRRESNPRPQALYRPLYILRSRYLILTSHTPTGRLVRGEPP